MPPYVVLISVMFVCRIIFVTLNPYNTLSTMPKINIISPS